MTAATEIREPAPTTPKKKRGWRLMALQGFVSVVLLAMLYFASQIESYLTVTMMADKGSSCDTTYSFVLRSCLRDVHFGRQLMSYLAPLHSACLSALVLTLVLRYKASEQLKAKLSAIGKWTIVAWALLGVVIGSMLIFT